MAIQQNFTDNNVVTITLASLANGAIAISSAIDNSTNKYISAVIQGKITTAGTIAINGSVAFAILRSVDGGTTYDDANIVNARSLSIFQTPATGLTYYFSLDTAAVGNLPSFWKIMVVNNSGDAFSATAGDHYVKFTGKKYETV